MDALFWWTGVAIYTWILFAMMVAVSAITWEFMRNHSRSLLIYLGKKRINTVTGVAGMQIT